MSAARLCACGGLLIAGILSLAHAQDLGQPGVLEAAFSMVEALRSPLELSDVPLTNNGTAVRIPDIDQTWALLYRTPNLTEPLSEEAIQLLNFRNPDIPENLPLRLHDALFGNKPPGASSNDSRPQSASDPLGPLTDGQKDPRLSSQWATLSGSSYWISQALIIAMADRCRCTPATPSSPDLSPLWSSVETSVGGEGCSPRSETQRGLFVSPQHPAYELAIPKPPQFLDRQAVVKALFENVVHVLRSDQAIPILESIKLQDSRLFSYNISEDEAGKRIVKVAGLPESAVGNMRGFLTIRQYALYQLLKRGESDCPIAPTDCGKFGPDRCDTWP